MFSLTVTYAELFRPSAKPHSLLYDIAWITGGSLFIALAAQWPYLYPSALFPSLGNVWPYS